MTFLLIVVMAGRTTSTEIQLPIPAGCVSAADSSTWPGQDVASP